MIRPIVRSKLIFARAAVPATAADAPVAQDLLDTLAAHAQDCVGLAANMIGSPKSIIAVQDGPAAHVMFNPNITEQSAPYQTEESCLSFTGARPTTRYQRIVVEYDELVGTALVPRRRTFTGYTAQIIQHEVDHCRGIAI